MLFFCSLAITVSWTGVCCGVLSWAELNWAKLSLVKPSIVSAGRYGDTWNECSIRKSFQFSLVFSRFFSAVFLWIFLSPEFLSSSLHILFLIFRSVFHSLARSSSKLLCLCLSCSFLGTFYLAFRIRFHFPVVWMFSPVISLSIVI